MASARLVLSLLVAACGGRTAPAEPIAAKADPTPEPRDPQVAISSTEVRIDERVAYTLPVNPELLDSEIVELVTALTPRCGAHLARITVAADVAYGVLFPVMFSVRRAGCTRFDLSLAGGAVIPHRADFATHEKPEGPRLGGRLELMLTVRPARLELSSRSRDLNRDLAAADELTGALDELVARCFADADGPRSPQDRQIFVAAERSVRADRLVPALAATVDSFPDHIFVPPHVADDPPPGRPPPPPPPADAQRITVQIHSHPPGASVAAEHSAAKLGVTPMMLTLDRAQLPFTVRVWLDGYAPTVLVIDGSASSYAVRLDGKTDPAGCPPRR